MKANNTRAEFTPKTTPCWLAMALGVCLPFGAFAGEPASDSFLLSKNPVQLDPVADDFWETDIRLDGWILQMYMELSQDSLGIDSSYFLGFDDILKSLDWVVPIGADIRYKRFGFMPDLVAMKASGSNATSGGRNFYDSADASIKSAILNLAAYYRVIDKPDFTLDLIGGARYLYVDFDVTLSGGRIGDRRGDFRTGTTGEIWDAIGGARVQQNLGDHLFYWVYGDAGAGDSELTWQVWGNLGYRFTETLSIAIGYRYLYYGKAPGSAELGLTASGPIITTNWEF